MGKASTISDTRCVMVCHLGSDSSWLSHFHSIWTLVTSEVLESREPEGLDARKDLDTQKKQKHEQAEAEMSARGTRHKHEHAHEHEHEHEHKHERQRQQEGGAHGWARPDRGLTSENGTPDFVLNAGSIDTTSSFALVRNSLSDDNA